MSTNRKNRTFTEFKADAVQLFVAGNRAIAQLARELEINESSIGYWVKAYRVRHPDPEVAPLPVDAGGSRGWRRRIGGWRRKTRSYKSRGLLREGAAVSEKSTLIHAEKAHHTIELMARLLGVSRAGLRLSGCPCY